MSAAVLDSGLAGPVPAPCLPYAWRLVPGLALGGEGEDDEDALDEEDEDDEDLDEDDDEDLDDEDDEDLDEDEDLDDLDEEEAED